MFQIEIDQFAATALQDLGSTHLKVKKGKVPLKFCKSTSFLKFRRKKYSSCSGYSIRYGNEKLKFSGDVRRPKLRIKIFTDALLKGNETYLSKSVYNVREVTGRTNLNMKINTEE